MIENLDSENFLLYAAKHYDNPQCFSTDEFYDDLKRFKYIHRLINKYKTTGEIKEQLLLNHLVILYNMFGPEPTTRMLFVKFENNLSILKPFLLLLNFLPPVVYNINNKNINTADIALDQHIVQTLRKI